MARRNAPPPPPSRLDKCPTGIRGLDAITKGGLPRGRPTLVDQIVAIPTLVRRLPPSMRTIIGDLNDTARTLVGLQLRPAQSHKARQP
jgi:hypothetical protein